MQIAANVVIFVCVNVVGVLLHTLMEHAQRRAFLDTRNCIAARLEMEDENEKLVRSTLFVTLTLTELLVDIKCLCVNNFS